MIFKNSNKQNRAESHGVLFFRSFSNSIISPMLGQMNDEIINIKIPEIIPVFLLCARVEGIEPPLEVLETPVLPLYYTRLRTEYGATAGKPAKRLKVIY